MHRLHVHITKGRPWKIKASHYAQCMTNTCLMVSYCPLKITNHFNVTVFRTEHIVLFRFAQRTPAL